MRLEFLQSNILTFQACAQHCVSSPLIWSICPSVSSETKPLVSYVYGVIWNSHQTVRLRKRFWGIQSLIPVLWILIVIYFILCDTSCFQMMIFSGFCGGILPHLVSWSGHLGCNFTKWITSPSIFSCQNLIEMILLSSLPLYLFILLFTLQSFWWELTLMTHVISPPD